MTVSEKAAQQGLSQGCSSRVVTELLRLFKTVMVTLTYNPRLKQEDLCKLGTGMGYELQSRLSRNVTLSQKEK